MITLFINTYTKGGREVTRAFTYATEATSHAQEILADTDVASVSTWRYQASGTFKDALLIVMGAATAPKEAWAEQRSLQCVTTRKGTTTRRV
jgi:hypothetical protein